MSNAVSTTNGADLPHTVFYSWQSDLPNKTNRTLIHEAIEKALKALNASEEIYFPERDLELDKDTSGVAGSPDIDKTIFRKIAAAAVFVCDVSFINQLDKKRTPNPNVLIELGYAIDKLGSERVIMLFNNAFGDVKDLPFDINRKRVAQYHCEETEAPAAARNSLVALLTDALKASIRHVHDNHKPKVEETLFTKLLSEIDSDSVERQSTATDYATWLGDELAALDPKAHPDNHQVFWDSLPASIPLAEGFSTICRRIAKRNDLQTALGLYTGFQSIVSRYPTGLTAGVSFQTDSDYIRFHGQELFVILVASLLKESRFSILNELLYRKLLVITEEGKRNRAFHEISSYCEILNYRKRQLRLDRVSLQADALKDRHEKTALKNFVDHEEFMSAEYFLSLRCRSSFPDERWLCWSLVFFDRSVPDFIAKAESQGYVTQLCVGLGLPDLAAFQIFYAQNGQDVFKWVRSFDKANRALPPASYIGSTS